jgi:glycosyltransferase involved in cell wall biosynthesis
MWRAPRNTPEMVRGLNDIIDNYDRYREEAIKHANSLSWLNRSKELVKLYESKI